ncbi:ribonuclease H-like domain-containing protein [Obelidium mucronatum]|nr:ribonuclease H-like domain-containing protein [Obelidium mucronatum]
MSAADAARMPPSVQAAVVALLTNPDTSPLAFYLITAFPASFVSSNDALFKHLLTCLSQLPCTTTELFNLIQPPFYILPKEGPLPPHILDALVFLIESGEVQIAPILKAAPTLLHSILGQLNSSWETTLSLIEAEFDKDPGSIGFSHKTAESTSANDDDSKTQQQKALSRNMMASKSVLKVASLCGISMIASSSSNHQYSALVAVAKFTTLKWILFEIVKFFEVIQSSPEIELDDDAYLEGPLALLPDIIRDINERYRPLALKLSVEEMISKLSAYSSDQILLKVLELTLHSFGYSASTKSTEWAWVEQTMLHCKTNGNGKTIILVSKEEAKESEPETTNFYTSGTNALFVFDTSTLAQFEEATKRENCNCIALDCEWRPDSFKLIGEEDTPAATLQVAVSKLADDGTPTTVISCFVLGLLEIEESEFVRVIGSLFSDTSVLKLGFGFSEDASRLKLRYPSLNIDIKNMYDMSRVTSVQKTKNCFGNKKKIGLNDLVKYYLKVSMEKRIRLSNWEMRPLTARQISYAANDSLALLDAYTEMKKAGDVEIGHSATSKEKKSKHKKQRM